MNTTNAFRLGAVVLLAGALIAGLFIFQGDGDDDTISSAERRELVPYFDELNAITTEADTAIRNLQSQYSNTSTNLQDAKAYYPQYVTLYQTFIDQAEEIDPPAVVADEHEEYLAAARVLQSRNREVQMQLDAATDISELETIFARTDAAILAENRGRHACVDLGDIARSLRIPAPAITGCTRPIEINQTVEPSAAP